MVQNTFIFVFFFILCSPFHFVFYNLQKKAPQLSDVDKDFFKQVCRIKVLISRLFTLHTFPGNFTFPGNGV